jgi:ribosomal protein L11 methyltransferase
MDWLQVQIDLDGIDPQAVETALTGLGALAIEYRDAGNEPILEPPPGTTPMWRELRLGALLPADTAPETVQLVVAAAVAPAPLPAMRFKALAERDWVRDFSAGLRPVCFADVLWLVPPDQPAPPGAAVVTLEPGLAFGSGSHPTTALCLEWLARLRCPGRVLDYGCGSGVLGLAALALGAQACLAVDVDPQARVACAANARRNGMGDRLRVVAPGALPDGIRFDAVVANILSDTLIVLAPALCARLATGASIALSGILGGQVADVRSAYRRRIDFAPVQRRGDWALLSGRAR